MMLDIQEEKQQLSTREIASVGLFAALLTVCSWITLPLTVPFTMQTFAVFLTLLLLGGKLGTYTICVYLTMGAVGRQCFRGCLVGWEDYWVPLGAILWDSSSWHCSIGF